MSVEEAARVMAQHQIRRLPIVEADKLVGMVSLGDLAVNNHSSDEAGQALKDISNPAGNLKIHTLIRKSTVFRHLMLYKKRVQRSAKKNAVYIEISIVPVGTDFSKFQFTGNRCSTNH